jgi:ABC-type multidrug transport system fused ATPase/permease subunit
MNKKEEEKQNQDELKDMKRFIDNLLISVTKNKDMGAIAIYKRYLFYVFFSLMIFFIFLFLIIKDILLLQFKKIKWEFKKMNIVDKAIKNMLQV